MKRKKILVFSILGGLLLVVAGLSIFILVQRATHGSASSFRPGMMMREGGSGFAAGPNRLIAVSPQGTPVPAASDETSQAQNSASQTVGNLVVTLALSPYPPKSFSQTDFSVTLKDENGQPVTDAAISLDLTMPEMPMPSNVVEVKPDAEGIYQSPGRFTMRGWWRIEVIIQRNGEKLSAFFDLGL